MVCLINFQATQNTTSVVIKTDVKNGEISEKLEKMKACIEMLTSSISDDIKLQRPTDVTFSILQIISGVIYSISKNDHIKSEDHDTDYDASFRLGGGPGGDSI